MGDGALWAFLAATGNGKNTSIEGMVSGLNLSGNSNNHMIS
jgi:hypothetical protein